MKFLICGINLLLDNGLQSHVDTQSDVSTLFRKLFLPPVNHDLSSPSVVLDHPKPILTAEFSIEHLLNPVDAMPRVVNKAEHMAEHFPIGVAAHRILLEVEPPEACFLHCSYHSLRIFLAYCLADHDIGTLGAQLLGQFGNRHLQERSCYGS